MKNQIIILLSILLLVLIVLKFKKNVVPSSFYKEKVYYSGNNLLKVMCNYTKALVEARDTSIPIEDNATLNNYINIKVLKSTFLNLIEQLNKMNLDKTDLDKYIKEYKMISRLSLNGDKKIIYTGPLSKFNIYQTFSVNKNFLDNTCPNL